MSSLWDWLPPEIEEHVLQYVKFTNSPMQQNLSLHRTIKRYYYDVDNKRHHISWPYIEPKPVNVIRRDSERGASIEIRKDVWGCIRYYRKIYGNNVHSRHIYHNLDITQANMPLYYGYYHN